MMSMINEAMEEADRIAHRGQVICLQINLFLNKL